MKNILLILFIFVSISGFSQIEKAFQNIRVDSVKALDGERLTIGKTGDTTNIDGVLYNNGSELSSGVWTESGTTATYNGDAASKNYYFSNDYFSKYSGLSSNSQTKKTELFDGSGMLNLSSSITSDSLYLIKEGNSIYVRSRMSGEKDIVVTGNVKTINNLNWEFSWAYLISSSTPNIKTSYTGGTPIHNATDNITPPITYNVNTIGGAHGFLLPYIKTTHDKDVTDYGSVWNDGSTDYTLFSVEDDTLRFRPTETYSGSDWIYDVTIAGTLTHVSGAAHTADITGGVTSAESVRPVYKDYSLTFKINGETEAPTNFSGYINSFDIISEYTIVDPRSVTIANPTDWTDGTDWFTLREHYVFQDFGAVTTYTELIVKDSIRILWMPAVMQSILYQGSYDTILAYMPKVDPITVTGTVFDFANIDTLAGKTITFTDAYSTSGTNKNDRYVSLLKNDAERPDVGFATGYNLDYFNSDTTWRANSLTNTIWSISSVGKSHAYWFDDTGTLTDTAMTTVTYRQYFDPEMMDSCDMVYFHREGNYDYVYVTAHQTFLNDTLSFTKLPAAYFGKSISIVENRGFSIADYKVNSNGIVFTNDSTHGYIVLKLFGNSLSTDITVNSTTYKNDFDDYIKFNSTTPSYLLSDDNNNFIWGGKNGSNLSGSTNTFIGYSTGYFNLSGSNNVAIGANAMKPNSAGGAAASNTFVGAESGYNVTAATGSVGIGYRSLYSKQTGNYATALGYFSGYNATGTYGIFLGYYAGYHETGNYKILIDNRYRTNEATARIEAPFYAETGATMAAQTVTLNGAVTISLDDVPTTPAADMIYFMNKNNADADTIAVYNGTGWKYFISN